MLKAFFSGVAGASFQNPSPPEKSEMQKRDEIIGEKVCFRTHFQTTNQYAYIYTLILLKVKMLCRYITKKNLRIYLGDIVSYFGPNSKTFPKIGRPKSRRMYYGGIYLGGGSNCVARLPHTFSCACSAGTIQRRRGAPPSRNSARASAVSVRRRHTPRGRRVDVTTPPPPWVSRTTRGAIYGVCIF